MLNERHRRARWRRGLVVALVTATAGALPAPALAQDPDFYGQPLPIDIGDSLDAITTGYNIEAGEQLTPNDGAFGCANGKRGTGGTQMGATIWYQFGGGDGRTLTLSTRGSNYDTMVAVWNGGLIVRCHNDVVPGDDTTSELRFQALAGVDYRFQLGGACDENGCWQGSSSLSLFEPPGNDGRSAAIAVLPGVQRSGTNVGATEAGEPQVCTSRGARTPLGKTVWYRFTAPTEGTAVFSATDPNLDSVLAVYPAGQNSALGCDDDPNAAGSSRLPLTLGAGTYDVQIGGYGTGVAAADGDFIYSVEFSRGIDEDADSVRRPPVGDDCNDRDRGVRPGAAEVLNNAVDENCDGLQGFDRDGDRSVALRRPDGRFVSGDCNDSNRKVHPGARDVPGNKLNEDCVRGPAPYAANPARIKARYVAFSAYTLFRELRVTSVRGRSRITMTCRGRACPFKRAVKNVRRRKRNVTLMRNRRMPLRVRLEVRVKPRGRIGVGRRFTTRSAVSPRDVDFCFRPSGRRIRC
jgi:hypothetical protein